MKFTQEKCNRRKLMSEGLVSCSLSVVERRVQRRLRRAEQSRNDLKLKMPQPAHSQMKRQPTEQKGKGDKSGEAEGDL